MIINPKDVVLLLNALKRSDLNYKQIYNSLCKITIFLICLVISAGGFVRMTGSGMGCPDWPKCFGVWVPPTSVDKITWEKEAIYESNQMIIYNDTLWVAQNDCISKNKFNRDNCWKKYEEHDYATFNLAHTWTEYINRLFGALAGLFCCVLFMISIFTKNWYVIVFSSFLCLLMFFQAWMGGQVVESVLDPFKITIHMLIAMLIVSILIFLYHYTSSRSRKELWSWIQLKNKFIFFAISISIIQIILGTQVRENIDELLILYDKIRVISQLPLIFDFHKAVALLVLFSNGALIFYYRKLVNKSFELKGIIIVLLFLFFTGLSMNFQAFLGVYQWLHLLCAISLFMFQFSILLKQCDFPILKFPSSV